MSIFNTPAAAVATAKLRPAGQIMPLLPLLSAVCMRVPMLLLRLLLLPLCLEAVMEGNQV